MHNLAHLLTILYIRIITLKFRLVDKEIGNYEFNSTFQRVEFQNFHSLTLKSKTIIFVTLKLTQNWLKLFHRDLWGKTV